MSLAVGVVAVGCFVAGGWQAAQPAAKVIGISTSKIDKYTVIYRLWSNGGIDRRMVLNVGSRKEDVLTQGGPWRVIEQP